MHSSVNRGVVGNLISRENNIPLKGRPRKRWIDEVEEGMKITGIRNWLTVAKDRQEWRKIVLEVKVHNNL